MRAHGWAKEQKQEFKFSMLKWVVFDIYYNWIKRTSEKPCQGIFLASKANLKESIRMFESIIEDVTFHAYSGKSLEEVQAMSDITKKYDDLGYGDYFITKDQFIAALYAAPAAKFKAAKK